MIEDVKAFEGGYCRQLLAMIDRRSWRLVRFQAVFFALRHPREGWVLVDTGYGSQFAAATDRFPGRFYRWATPVTPLGRTGALLEAAGITPTEIRHVVITHFHADHIGGLAEFPHATIHFHAGALAPLRALTAGRQVRAAFLSALVPEWLPDRAHAIPATAFQRDPTLPFGVHDLFGDGEIRLVDLPGHAPGQVGVLFARGEGRQEFYAADAYWRRCQIEAEAEPLPIALHFQWDPVAYRATVGLLRDLARAGTHRLHACHDEGTCARLHER